MTPTPSGCPAAGSLLSVDAALAVDEACLPTDPVQVAGWWGRPVAGDPLPARINAVMRGRLPDVRGPDIHVPTLPIDQLGLAGHLPFASIDDRWVTVTMRLASDQEHCFWRLGNGGITDPAAPAWTCPLHGQAETIDLVAPPDAALAGCPVDARLPVRTFAAFPPACFGVRTVELTGWFDTWYVIGGWEAPWTITPAWLWSMQIGPVPVLSESSDPADKASLVLHLDPGSAVATATRNRFVVLAGHYARPAEYERCRFLGTTDLPITDARDDCARAFVVESVRDGQPG